MERLLEAIEPSFLEVARLASEAIRTGQLGFWEVSVGGMRATISIAYRQSLLPESSMTGCVDDSALPVVDGFRVMTLSYPRRATLGLPPDPVRGFIRFTHQTYEIRDSEDSLVDSYKAVAKFRDVVVIQFADSLALSIRQMVDLGISPDVLKDVAESELVHCVIDS